MYAFIFRFQIPAGTFQPAQNGICRAHVLLSLLAHVGRHVLVVKNIIECVALTFYQVIDRKQGVGAEIRLSDEQLVLYSTKPLGVSVQLLAIGLGKLIGLRVVVNVFYFDLQSGNAKFYFLRCQMQSRLFGVRHRINSFMDIS